jgi:Ni/Co efflux regulator RcnB
MTFGANAKRFRFVMHLKIVIATTALFFSHQRKREEERERKREREREREKDRQKEKERKREREREKDTDRLLQLTPKWLRETREFGGEKRQNEKDLLREAKTIYDSLLPVI